MDRPLLATNGCATARRRESGVSVASAVSTGELLFRRVFEEERACIESNFRRRYAPLAPHGGADGYVDESPRPSVVRRPPRVASCGPRTTLPAPEAPVHTLARLPEERQDEEEEQEEALEGLAALAEPSRPQPLDADAEANGAAAPARRLRPRVDRATSPEPPSLRAPGERVRFSVAFSGGGVRACAFQAGVLWRLAQSGRLRDVEYLAAVSGGSYIAAAFASHVVQAGEPEPGSDVDAWYLAVVARTIARMQHNWPYLARDLGKGPFRLPRDGSSCIPRIFDVPLLICILAFTLLIKPLLFVILFVAPVMELVEFFFGGMMRIVNCSAFWNVPLNSNTAFLIRANQVLYIRVFCFMTSATFCTWLLKDRLISTKTRLWLLLKGVISSWKCLVIGMILLFWLTYGVTLTQIWASESLPYASRTMPVCDQDRLVVELHCAGFLLGDELPTWRFNATAAATSSPWQPAEIVKAFLLPFVHYELLFSAFGVALMLAVSVMMMPFFPKLFGNLMSVLGPLTFVNLVTGLIRWRVFSPGYQHNWHISYAALCLALVCVPAYNFLVSTMHMYYKRSLHKAFFAKGDDISWKCVEARPYCPFLLFTGTANDYKRPGDDSSITRMTFSSLHIGSEKTGYVRNSMSRSLSQIVALSGAATDGVILGKKDQFRFTFWLEVLNLYMGDFILFEARRPQILQRYSLQIWGSRLSESVLKALYRFPVMLFWEIVYGLLLLGLTLSHEKCQATKGLFQTAAILGIGAILLSFFFGFLPCTDLIQHSALVRSIHRATRFNSVAERPPSLLYVTDGGILDSTGLVELVRRRCERILLVYGGQDPKDTMKSIKKAMQIVTDERLGSFYDPGDPRRNVDELFERYRREPDMPYIHFGILYRNPESDNAVGIAGEFLEEQPRTTGHIFLVKNRVPPEMAGAEVEPLLTEEEIIASSSGANGRCRACGGAAGAAKADGGGSAATAAAPRRAPRQKSLGGMCCDCCHGAGLNFGRKFPNPPTWNQFITPQMFNCLCRLGFNISASALEACASPDGHARTWEGFV